MSEIQELERELHVVSEEIGSERSARNRARAKARNKDARIEELLDVVDLSQKQRDNNRTRLVKVRRRLEAVELDGVSAAEREVWGNLDQRQENLVDENEELTALIRHALPRIDDLDERREHLKDLQRDFGDELRLALSHRERVRDQLAQARRDAASNPLGTPYFVIAEFDCHDGTPVPASSYPALRANVLDYLVPLRKAGGPVHVNSGYRTEPGVGPYPGGYNAHVGGATLSCHCYRARGDACAADHWQEGRSPSAVQAWHEVNTHPSGMGRYTTFTHVDNRHRIGWAVSRWNGP